MFVGVKMIGNVRNIITHSAVDGPGNRLVVFLQGCNFNCLYCHNPETIPLHGDDSPFKMSVEDVVKVVSKHADYLSGVTFSGGECTLQMAFLTSCCKALKEMGVHILIDTNGSASWVELQALMPFVDGFMVDLKALDPKIHFELTNFNNDSVLQNILNLWKAQKLFELRFVVVEGFTDTRQSLEWVSRQNLMHIPIKLIKYRAHGVTKEAEHLKTPSDETMNALKLYALTLGFDEKEIKII